MLTSELLYRLWAKTNELDRERDGNPLPWSRHPLPCHLVDVGHVAEVWLEADPHLLERFCGLWPGVPREAARRALVLAAALHDLGKVHQNFQAKSDQGWAHGYAGVWQANRPSGSFDHGRQTARFFNTFKSRRGSRVEGADPRWVPLIPLMQVAAGHHGRLFDSEAAAADLSLKTELLRSRVFALIDEITNLFGEPPEVPSEPPSAFLMLAAGFVSVCDWIGSDSRYFSFAPEVSDCEALRQYLDDLRRREVALTALRRAGLIAELRPKASFAELFSPEGELWQPNSRFQSAGCEIRFGVEPGPEILIVEAPMGLGKTEIALYLAAQAMHHGHADGLYFALPTQATANALFDRVRSYAERIKGDDHLPLVLAHGARRYFEDFRQLMQATRRLPFARSVGGGGRNGEEAPPSEVIATSWLMPSKRALLAPVGLGTIDQALLGAMAVRHGFVRLFGMARKVVVFDEIHAYDVYMGVLIERLLEWLGALGCKVIIISATLPMGLRNKLLTAYGAQAVEAADGYPQAIHVVLDGTVEVVDEPVDDAQRKDILIETVEGDDRAAAGVEWVMERLDEKGGCIAWIRNTVREAQEAARMLRGRGIEVDLLHARFTRRDRNRNEESLLQRFGKPAPENPVRPARRVVVATQVIEQSVDVDFDAMLSDLAPVDLLLQRAGRLWRHDREDRRHGHRGAVLGVLLPNAADRAALLFGTSAFVYDAETLARSATIVLDSDRWHLPDACRELVALLYERGRDYWTHQRLDCDPVRLDGVQETIDSRRQRMVTYAAEALTCRPGQSIPTMREAQPDTEDETGMSFATRYGGQSAAIALFELAPDGPRPLRATHPLIIPDGDDYGARLEIDEAVTLATVSFPWYGQREADTQSSHELVEIAAWWKATHPFDRRLFAIVRDGRFELDGLSGTYTSEYGLVLDRPETSLADAPPFEDT